MDDYWRDFVEESEENITELNNLLLDLERSPDDEAVLDRIFRTAHTLKGNSGAMGLERASDLAHALEDLLDGVRAGEVEVTSELMDTVFDAVDALDVMVEEVALEGDIETDPADTIAALRAPLSEAAMRVTPPSDGEIDATIARFDPPSDPEHEAFLVRMAIPESGQLNNGLVVIEALIDAFDLLGTDPSRTAIENREYGSRIDAVFATAVGEAAIAAALEPVEAVADFEIAKVTDRFDAAATSSDGADPIDSSMSPDLSSNEANELSVDELLEEFEELDDIDALAEEIDDVSEFDDIGPAGSFDDIVEADSPSESTAADGPAAADVGDRADDADDEVEDASAVFQELKEEVEMVGFDELQAELDELEFDQFDSDDEIGMDELLGGDVDPDDPTFLEGDAGWEPESTPTGEERPTDRVTGSDTFDSIEEPAAEAVADAEPAAEAVADEGAQATGDDGFDDRFDDEAEEGAGDDDEAEVGADERDDAVVDDEVDESTQDAGVDVEAGDAREPESTSTTPGWVSNAQSGTDDPATTAEADGVDAADAEADSPTDSEESSAFADALFGGPSTDPSEPTEDSTTESDEDEGDVADGPVVASADGQVDVDSDAEPFEADRDDVGVGSAADDEPVAGAAGATDSVESVDAVEATSDEPAIAPTEADEIERKPALAEDDDQSKDDVDEPGSADEGLPDDAAEAPATDVDEGEPATDDVEGEPETDEVEERPGPDEVEEGPATDDVDGEPATDVDEGERTVGDDDAITADSPESSTDAASDEDGIEATFDEDAVDMPVDDLAGDAEFDGLFDGESEIGSTDAADGQSGDEPADESGADESADAASTDAGSSDSDAGPDVDWDRVVDEDEDADGKDDEPGRVDPDSAAVEPDAADVESTAERTDDPAEAEEDEGDAEDGVAVDSEAEPDAEDVTVEADSATDVGDTTAEASVETDEDTEADDVPAEADAGAVEAEPRRGPGEPVEDTADETAPEVDDEVGEDSIDDFGTADDAFDPVGDLDDVEFGPDDSIDALDDDLDYAVAGLSEDEDLDATASSEDDDAFASVDAELDVLSDIEEPVDDAFGATGADDSFGDAATIDDSFDDVDADDVSGSFGPAEDDFDPGETTSFGDEADDGGESDIARLLDELSEMAIPDIDIPEQIDQEAAEEMGDHAQSVRVDNEQIDTLLQLVEGLVTSRVRLRTAVDAREDFETLERELDDLEDITAELQETVMDVRLVPLQTVTNRLPRVVRDLAREQGKRITFDQENEHVELDRSILDRIGDPLIHLVRNAVDHGIEDPETREDAGKPPEGSITLSAERSRDRVTIEISDDGSGLEAERIRDEAVAADVLTESEADALSNDEVYDLVFHPGLSTADEVTDVSGRGVGMDVVRRTVDELNGHVVVESEPGEGTTVRMTLPVSVAIDDVLFVESGGEQFGVPVKVIDDIADAALVGRSDDGLVYDAGDEALPVIELGEAMGAAGTGANGDGMVVRIRGDVREVALHCDDVQGRQEVVVKPFEGFIRDVPGLSGATVRGRGEVVTILDVTTL